MMSALPSPPTPHKHTPQPLPFKNSKVTAAAWTQRGSCGPSKRWGPVTRWGERDGTPNGSGTSTCSSPPAPRGAPCPFPRAMPGPSPGGSATSRLLVPSPPGSSGKGSGKGGGPGGKRPGPQHRPAAHKMAAAGACGWEGNGGGAEGFLGLL